jgi:hypothetical protein
MIDEHHPHSYLHPLIKEVGEEEVGGIIEMISMMIAEMVDLGQEDEAGTAAVANELGTIGAVVVVLAVTSSSHRRTGNKWRRNLLVFLVSLGLSLPVSPRMLYEKVCCLDEGCGPFC